MGLVPQDAEIGCLAGFCVATRSRGNLSRMELARPCAFATRLPSPRASGKLFACVTDSPATRAKYNPIGETMPETTPTPPGCVLASSLDVTISLDSRWFISRKGDTELMLKTSPDQFCQFHMTLIKVDEEPIKLQFQTRDTKMYISRKGETGLMLKSIPDQFCRFEPVNDPSNDAKAALRADNGYYLACMVDETYGGPELSRSLVGSLCYLSFGLLY